MRRYLDPATILVKFGAALQWKNTEIAGAGPAAKSDTSEQAAGCILIKRGAGADYIEKQLMSREGAVEGSARGSSSYSDGVDDYIDDDEGIQEEGNKSIMGGMLLKYCMCSSVLLLCSITALLLLLPLVLPAPLPPPPLELLLLPLLILLILLCLALSPPSSPSTNL